MGWNEITGVKIHDYTDFEDAASGASLAEGTIVHFWRGDPSLIKQTVKKDTKWLTPITNIPTSIMTRHTLLSKKHTISILWWVSPEKKRI